MSEKPSVHKKLPGLNALRAIAASIVLVGHVYQIAGLTGLTKDNMKPYYIAGDEMVNLFFVISGFIITYILLIEKRTTNTVNLKEFYFKRILRIWPIYFLIFFSVVILQQLTNVYSSFDSLTLNSFWAYLLFAVNLNQILFYVNFSVLPHYWSLSVEEQFYLYWPFVIKKINVVLFSICLVAFWIIARNSFAFLASHGYGIAFNKLNDFFSVTRFPSMGIGAIGAYAVVNKKNWLKIFISSRWQALLWIVALVTTALRWKLYIPYVHSEVLACIYLLLILNVINNSPKSITEGKLLNQTGIISYGIYMYQWPLIPIVIYFLKKYHLASYFSSFHFVPLVLLCYVLTWLLSYVSFYFFEMKFLKMKDKKKPALATASTFQTNP